MKRKSKKDTQINPKENKKNTTEIEKKSFISQYLKYIFLVVIVYFIGKHLYNEVSGKTFFEGADIILQIIAIITGLISIFIHKKEFSKIINENFSEKDIFEKQNFRQRIINLFGVKDRLTTVLIIVIVGLSAFTLFYKLDNFDIFSDEVQVTKGAAGYYYTGEYRQWDFIKEHLVGKPYNRAKPHQFIVAQSYKIFGINAFAARFPSAIFGILSVVLLFFIGKFFIKDKYAALLAAFSFALYFEFLFLGRWARMYAMVYPLFLTAFFLTFEFLTKENPYKLFNSDKYPILQQYFNFNYIYLPPLLILLYLSIFIHSNIVVLFVIFFVFIIIAVLLFRDEKKYLTAFIVFSLILIIQIFSPYKVNFSRFSFFKIDNSPVYNKVFFSYPFLGKINIIFLLLSFFGIFLTENNNFRKKYLILFISIIVPWFFFSYIINFAPNYRYASFLTPLSVLLIVGSFMLINKVLYSKTIQIFLSLLLITSVVLNYSKHFKSLYVENSFLPAKPSLAQKTIVENIHKGDVIFKHWGPKIYLRGIPKETEFLSLGGYQGRSLSEIYKDMQRKPHGWLVWHKYNESRFDQNFVSYCNLYFKKYAGYGIDNYGEEIYYYDKKMLQPLELFAYQQYFPAANLSLKNSYSFVFNLKINKKTNGSIFFLRKDSIIDVNCFIRNTNLIIKTSENDSVYISIPENQNNQVFWAFSPEKSILYLNREKLTEKNISLQPDLVKFMINPQFNGYFNNMRLYDFVLNDNQIKAIVKDKNISEELETDNQTFRTLFLWKKK